MDRVVRVTTAASETEGVAAVSWIESLMIRRPLGSIDPNSIREAELHTAVPVQQYKHHVRSIVRSGVSPGGARSDGHHWCQAARTAATCT